MLIEIHMIQNHSPSNLNRDDLGAPKTCIFGGVTRARISSQCLKRSIRRSPEFAAALEKDGGVRTRRLIEQIARAAVGDGGGPRESDLKAIQKIFKDGGVGLDKSDEYRSDILFFLPQSAINDMGAAVKASNNDLGTKFAKVIGEFVQTPDIALCGRMTEFDAKGPFAGLKGKFTVEAALSAAHAISTHAVITEVDYFTAADDVAGTDAARATSTRRCSIPPASTSTSPSTGSNCWPISATIRRLPREPSNALSKPPSRRTPPASSMPTRRSIHPRVSSSKSKPPRAPR